MPEISRQDEIFMKEAIKLALKGLGLTSPNPMVGAIVVKNGRIMGKGWHRKAGEPHAEALAIEDAESKSRDADLYCTLEPCNHTGRTGPCTEKIIEAGIKRVFFGCEDPNPHVQGGGHKRLQEAGIKTIPGVLQLECTELNRAFFKWTRTGLPWVVLKAAMSMDGKIATRSGDSKWISSEASRKIAHLLRFEADAVLVGASTVINDDPALTVRLPGREKIKQPVRIVLDWKLDTKPGTRVFNDGITRTMLVTSTKSPERGLKTLESKGVEILRIPAKGDGADLKKMLLALGKMNVLNLLVEGGSETHGAFVDSGLFDEVRLFMAPIIIGGRAAKPFIGGLGISSIKSAWKMNIKNVARTGGDIYITARRTNVYGID